jgi:homoserine kinase
VQAATEILQEYGEKVFTVGKLVKRADEECIVRNMDIWG